MTHIDKAILLATANTYNIVYDKEKIEAAGRLLKSAKNHEERLALLLSLNDVGTSVFLYAFMDDPPPSSAITLEVLRFSVERWSWTDWLVKQYRDCQDVRRRVAQWVEIDKIGGSWKIELLQGLWDDFQNDWSSLLDPARIETGALQSLLRSSGCLPDNFPIIADLAAKRVLASRDEVRAEDWFGSFLKSAAKAIGDDAVLRWTQSALPRFAGSSRVWRPALRWLAWRIRECGGPRLDLGTLTPEQTSILGECWYKFALEDDRYRYKLLKEYGQDNYKESRLMPLLAVPAGSPFATRAVWTWLSDELIESALYTAYLRSEEAACELWDHNEDRVTSRLLDQIEHQLRRTQAELNKVASHGQPYGRLMIDFTSRDMRFGKDVAGADLAIILEVHAPKLHKRCSFLLIQAKKPSGNTLVLNGQLQKQLQDMLYHTHAAYVVVYPDREGKAMVAAPAAALQAACPSWRAKHGFSAGRRM